MFHNRPTYAGVKIYNHIPADIKDLTGDIKSYKKSTKELCARAFLLYSG
jgi:hypothetical protein